MADEVQLMLRIKEGDKSAFEELYHLYQIPLGNLFYRLSGDRTMAEDCLQEVFYRLWLYRASYQPTAKVITYLFQIAKNYWINEGKRLKRRPIPVSRLTSSETAEFADKQAGATSPQEAVSRELTETVKEAVSKLPEKERLVLVLHQYEGLKHREIAEILGMAEITVKTRFARALKRLEKYLKKYLQ